MGCRKDLVLKAGLVLTDSPDIRFKISNFTRANMDRLAKNWHDIRATLRCTAGLLTASGLTDLTLTADNVAIPVAYYLHTRGLGDSYLTSGKYAQDRERVRTWVFRSLLKRNVWGGSTDALLARLRSDLRDTLGQEGFPLARIVESMTKAGRSIEFTQDDVEELLDVQYGKARTFPAPALLCPGPDLSQQFHEDHIFPKSRFTRGKLKAEGVPEEQIGQFIERVNKLPNLQLLAGCPTPRSNAWSWEWLDDGHFGSDAAKHKYAVRNDLDPLPGRVSGFMAFYEQRKQRLASRPAKALGTGA